MRGFITGFIRGRFFRTTAFALVFSMLLVGSIPANGLAYVAGAGVLPPSDVSAQAPVNRGADMAKVQRVLESRLVSEKLHGVGLTDEEVRDRIEKLTDAELHQFASQIDALYPGGNAALAVLGVLLIIALIVLLVLKATGRKLVIK